MKRNLLFALLVLAALPLSALFAQPTTSGTEFWIGYMENIDLLFNDEPRFVVQTTAGEDANVTISVPATGLTFNFVSPAGFVTDFPLPQAVWYSEQSEIVDNKGIRVTADRPIQVRAFHYRAYFSESSLVLPVEELGTEYRVSCYLDEDQSQDSPTCLVIVSTADATEVEITPTALTEGLHPGGAPFSVVLDEGQSYQVQSAGDLTGTLIRSLSGSPVAVFSGATKANIEICFPGADSHLYDQAIPTDRWGADYLFVPFLGQGGDQIRVVAAENNTHVYIDCDEVASLNAGEFFQTKLDAAAYISADRPVSVAQFNSSQGCNPSGLGDPSMLQLFPATRQGFSTRWRASDEINGIGNPYFLQHFVNIVVPSDATGSLTLDGNPLAATFTTYAANPNFAWTQVELDEGFHSLTGTAPFLAYSYGFGDFDAYTMNLDYSGDEPNSVSDLSIVLDGVLCVDSTLLFSAQSDADLTEYLWTLNDEVTSEDAIFGIIPIDSGTYLLSLAAQTASGCPLIDNIAFQVEDCSETEACDLQFATAFTPDRDGNNDQFKALFNCTPLTFRLQVFSRWGELVFETTDPDLGWDGEFDDEALTSDVYIWRAEYQLPDRDNPDVDFGELHLIR